MEFEHISVMPGEVIGLLAVKKNGIYVDGTLGGGGHSLEILKAGAGRVIGIDRDTDALSAASERLAPWHGSFTPVHDNFKNVASVLVSLGVDAIDGGLLDLGVSSYQLDEASRGFSYMHDAPLDMRMDKESGFSAYDVLNTYDEKALSDIFFEYGEEKWSKRIAQFIVRRREKSPLETTGELVEIIESAIPKGARAAGGHPAKRVFQAVRIEVNGELKILEKALRDFVHVLKPGGRLAVITFHSLEDRITKNTFRDLCTDCICPKEFPVCVCGHRALAKAVTKKPVLPSAKEQEKNPRSRSAKLRIIEKC